MERAIGSDRAAWSAGRRSGLPVCRLPEAGSGADPALVAKGQQLAAQFGCIACRSSGTGAQGVGPTWKGLAGSQVQLDNGQTVAADDAYLKESIEQPDAKMVKGFTKGVMSAAVTPSNCRFGRRRPDALIAYMKSLK